MTLNRTALAVAVSVTALASSHAAFAQDTAPAAPQADPAASDQDAAPGSEIIVTGTRVAGRTKLDTASPVDVLSGASLRNQGTTELGSALAAVAPSIDFPRPSAVDGTDAIRPATLRGLSPDQTLVLINNVRAHTSALLNINGSVGRGSAATDLNTIPTVALDRIEVLRDGASAQYGSDAIAGVVNLRLREARSGGGVSTTYGFYNTDIETARGDRHTNGEHTVSVSGWQGIGFGQDGYLTISGEFVNRQPTNRADFDPRVTPSVVTGRFGDPAVTQYSLFANFGTSVGGGWKLYGWAGYQDRDSRSAAFPRLASVNLITVPVGSPLVTVGNTLTQYPNGFLPLINTKSRDLNTALGLKGDVAGWDVDLNVSYGRNKIGFRTLNSANYSYGAATPTNFSDGAIIYDQLVGGIDVSRKFDVFQSLNVALGVEGRREGFEIQAGEPASYSFGTAFPTAQAGAQGFGGFSPVNVVDKHRQNGSIYLDLEAQVTDKFLIGIAGRGEDYSDFGTTGTGKVSLRYDFTPWFALRGTASTGFRAPSLQQQYYTSVASVIVNGAPVLTGLYPSTSPVATALGGLPLKPEKSTNLSAGAVIRAGGFDLTVDGYYIKLRDQIGLSENIAAPTGNPANDTPTQAAIRAILQPQGVSAARFFLNGLASTTQGIDVVAHYRLRSAGAGTFDFTLAGNINKTDVTRVPTQTGPISGVTLFARSRILTLEEGTPGEKITGTIDWTLDKLAATARVTYYGDVNQPGTAANGAADIHTGQHAITDFELRYQPKKGAQVALGVNNLFDIYPDRTIAANNSTGVVGFPFYSPFGFNGRYLYARVGFNW